MGLDIHIFQVRKAETLEPRIYTLAELDARGFNYFIKEEVEEHLVQALIPYTQEVLVSSPKIDYSKIREDYGLSEDSFAIPRGFEGDLCFTDPTKTEDRHTDISAAEIALKYTVEQTLTYLAFPCDVEAYWNKDYTVHNFFLEKLGDVENTGFYKIDLDVQQAFNEEHGADSGEIPLVPPTEEMALFYHAWW